MTQPTPLLSSPTKTPHRPLSPHLRHFKSPANSTCPKPSTIHLFCHMSTSRETFAGICLLHLSTSMARSPGIILVLQQVTSSLHHMFVSPHLYSSPPLQNPHILACPLHSHQLSFQAINWIVLLPVQNLLMSSHCFQEGE